MGIEFLLGDLVLTSIYALILVLLLKVLYDYKPVLNKIIWFVVSFALLNGSTSYVFRLIDIEYGFIKALFLIVFSVALLKLLVRLEYKKGFVIFGIFVVILTVCELSTVGIISLLFPLKSGSVSAYAIASFAQYLLGNVLLGIQAFGLVFVLRFFKSYLRFPKNTKMLITTIALTVIIMLANIWFYFVNLNAQTGTANFMVVTLLMIVYLGYILFNININYRLETQKIELEQQKFYNDSLGNTLDNLRRFKHGYNNNLNVLYALVKIGDQNRLMNYFNEVMEMNNKLNDTIVFDVKNAGLYGVISSKMVYSEEKGVLFKIFTSSQVQEIENIRMIDLNEIMGILLDNAIEAAAVSEKKLVELNIGEDEECVSIFVKNTYEGQPDIGKIYEKGFSTKGNNRGMGLWIIKEVVAKNNKYVFNNTYIENEQFCQELIIKKSR